MKFKVFKFKNVSSTNDVAINLIKKDNEEIGCVYSEKQKKGRGTQGKKWISEEGNLFATIFFQLRNNFPPFNEFSIINPVIVAGVIEHYCKKKNISLKWPNDVVSLIISSYESFFVNINIYNYTDIKKKS